MKHLTDRDWSSVVKDFKATDPFNYAVLDDFLAPHTLATLRSELTGAKGWQRRDIRFVGLHSAAVVAPDGHALLFVGERKSGKSTLAVDFVNQAGCQLLTDEIVYLHRRTLLVEPFPIAVGVKPPGMEHVKGLIPAQEIVKSIAVHQAAATRVIILAPSDTGGRELVPLSEAAAMRELLKHYLDLGADTDEVMITLLRMATSTEIFQFRYRAYEDLFALREMLSSVKATVVESQSPSGLK